MRGVKRFERKHGGAGGTAGALHHRKPNHRPRRRAEIRHLEVDRTYGYLLTERFPVKHSPGTVLLRYNDLKSNAAYRTKTFPITEMQWIRSRHHACAESEFRSAASTKLLRLI